MNTQWDLILHGAKVFDGTGGAGELVDVAIRDGRIAARGDHLPRENAKAVRDVSGQWLIPGLLDIHTHEDLEAELDPGLPEMVRHGTTTAIMGNCSLGLAFGAQRQAGQDPIVDCFARVENIPKHVLSRAADRATWTTPQAYLGHLDTLPLAVNLATFLPHSMLRIEVMGLQESITRDSTQAEIDRMCAILGEAMDAGYLGLSTDGLPLHFLANQPNVKKRIPTQYAPFEEYRRLTDVVRERNGVWQMTPAPDDGRLTLKLMGLTSGRLYRKPLKVTALAALESVNNRLQLWQALTMVNVLNSPLLNGYLRMQSLAAPFRIYSEGVVSPLAEANPQMRRLIETELEDVEARRKILDDPAYIAEFCAMWDVGKRGWDAAAIRRKLGLERQFLTRDLNDMMIFRVPVPSWVDQSMAFVRNRYLLWLSGALTAANDQEEGKAFAAIGREAEHEGAFFLALLRHFDRDIHWYYVSANRNPETIKRLLLHPKLLPGFNDSGAHVVNMAYFDCNLRALNIAAKDSEALFAHMVTRLTREPAAFFGLDAGRIDIGSRADITLLNPVALRKYDGEANVQFVHRDTFGCSQLVNRSDGVVSGVYVRGTEVWDGHGFTAAHGTARLGGALRAGNGKQQ
jgi:N-acyl-D-aspartate/D-glutamate deacylase